MNKSTLGILLLVLMIAAGVLWQNIEREDPMAVQTQQSELKKYFENDGIERDVDSVEPALTKEEQISREFMEEMRSSGLVTDVDKKSMEILVDYTVWSSTLDAKAKRSFIKMSAEYFRYFNESGWNFSDGRPSISIYDSQSGKEIAGYSAWNGTFIN